MTSSKPQQRQRRIRRPVHKDQKRSPLTKTQRRAAISVKRSKGYYRTLEEARRRGRLGKCTCWDCLRRAGITPDLSMRDKHPTLQGLVLAGDYQGIPTRVAKESTPEEASAEAKAQAREEKAHLREAVANREAI